MFLLQPKFSHNDISILLGVREKLKKKKLENYDKFYPTTVYVDFKMMNNFVFYGLEI
jgi:hypothetical protein